MQDVQPELKKLQKKHKDNKEELNKEIAAFYKEKGINPLGCVVPLLGRMLDLQSQGPWFGSRLGENSLIGQFTSQDFPVHVK